MKPKRPWEKHAVNTSDPNAKFTWFGPEDTKRRFKFLISKEEGDKISLIPGEQKFKKGLKAQRWAEENGGEPELYKVVKVGPSRIDLVRVPKKDAPAEG